MTNATPYPAPPVCYGWARTGEPLTAEAAGEAFYAAFFCAFDDAGVFPVETFEYAPGPMGCDVPPATRAYLWLTADVEGGPVTGWSLAYVDDDGTLVPFAITQVIFRTPDGRTWKLSPHPTNARCYLLWEDETPDGDKPTWTAHRVGLWSLREIYQYLEAITYPSATAPAKPQG